MSVFDVRRTRLTTTEIPASALRLRRPNSCSGRSEPVDAQLPSAPTLPPLGSPSPAYLLELVASWHGLTSAQLVAGRASPRNSAAKFQAAWMMRQLRHSWPVIAKTLGYRGHAQAVHAARCWERMRAEASR